MEEQQILDEENEELNDDDVVYQINTFGADFTVDGLVKRFDKGNIYRPEFQRKFVWTVPQASKFVESILLGLPIPSVFLYREEDTRKHLIVDGLQRLTTLASFRKGILPETDRVFKLKDVKSRYEGKSFDDLDEEDQIRFEDAIIHAMIIQQVTPNDNNSSVFHIFDRLNSNGTPLQPQEIRAAVYHGPFQDKIESLNRVQDWRTIFGPEHKRGKDQELILRFLALAFDRENYSKPMKGFLNKFMQKNRTADDQTLSKFESAFRETISLICQAVGDRAFRPSRGFNVSAFDAVMVGLYESKNCDLASISSAYNDLMQNEEFISGISGSTSDEKSVESRIEIAKKAFVSVV